MKPKKEKLNWDKLVGAAADINMNSVEAQHYAYKLMAEMADEKHHGFKKILKK